MTKKLLIAMAMMASAGTMFADVDYYVATNGKDSNPGTETAPFATLEWTMMNVKPGQVYNIHLQKDATWMVGTIGIPEGTTVRIIGDNSTLKAAEKSHLDGGEGLRIMRTYPDCDVEIYGVNFVNGRQVAYWPGGAICDFGKRMVIDNCSFIDNMGSSGGGGIHSRGHYLEVRNSYFSGNNVEGGGGTGAAIQMIGNADAPNFGELIVDNCAFYDNHIDGGGGHGTVIAIFDPQMGYGITGKASVTNCTFLNNYNAQAYMADIDFSDNGECITTIVNNTMVNCEVGYNCYYQTSPVYMFNNFIFAKKNALSATLSCADDREAITAANNVLLGGLEALNANMDDPMLKSYENVLGTTAEHPLASYGMVSNMTREGNIGYLMTAGASSLADGGLVNSAEYTDGVNVIPATDCRGFSYKEGVKCIGSFQPLGTGIANIAADDTNAPAEYFNLQGIRVANPESGLYIVRQGRSLRKVMIK